MRNKIFIFLILIISTVFSQQTLIKKAVKKSGFSLIKKNSSKLKKVDIDLIIAKSITTIEKNGLGKITRFNNHTTKKILEETYKLRGEKEFTKMIHKLNGFSKKNSSNIKGYLAEEIHHNELLKLRNITEVESSFKLKTSKFVTKAQKTYISENHLKGKNITPHKLIELDLIAKTKKGEKFIIEVKNIDSKFTESLFNKYLNQAIKQRAYAIENGIDKIYWSNIGTSLLNPEQVKIMEKAGIKVLQNGSTSPIVNAKINMNKIKRNLI